MTTKAPGFAERLQTAAKAKKAQLEKMRASVSADGTQTAERPLKTSDDFLVPGPTAESNEGLARWGCTWLAFSLILILLMLAISFICLTLATWTGIA